MSVAHMHEMCWFPSKLAEYSEFPNHAVGEGGCEDGAGEESGKTGQKDDDGVEKGRSHERRKQELFNLTARGRIRSSRCIRKCDVFAAAESSSP